MNLRVNAEADLAVILEDDVYGGAWPITVTNPLNVNACLTGYSSDITQLVDPDTGQIVSGRLAVVALRIKSLDCVGLGIPEDVVDSTSKPWIIQFDDINGKPYKFKVSKSNPDRGSGVVTCILEAYI